MIETDLSRKLHYTLRIAIAMCFIGHGAFGIITKEAWCNYFAVFGIDKIMAYRLMPWVGGIDILMGIGMLFYPVRVIAAWLVGWGLLTASLRPFSGEPFAEFIERAGNYGAAFVLLVLSGKVAGMRGWFQKINPSAPVSASSLGLAIKYLQVVAFLLLLGHGWLNIIQKKGLLDQYASLGFRDAVQVALITGVFEITAAFSILIKPIRPLIFVLFIWKMGTELFYPHYSIFEWVERGGSYGALLALWFATQKNEAVVIQRPAIPLAIL